VPTGFPGEGRGPSSKRHFFQKICPITVEARLEKSQKKEFWEKIIRVGFFIIGIIAILALGSAYYFNLEKGRAVAAKKEADYLRANAEKQKQIAQEERDKALKSDSIAQVERQIALQAKDEEGKQRIIAESKGDSLTTVVRRYNLLSRESSQGNWLDGLDSTDQSYAISALDSLRNNNKAYYDRRRSFQLATTAREEIDSAKIAIRIAMKAQEIDDNKITRTTLEEIINSQPAIPKTSFVGHEDRLLRVAFSPNGQLILTGSNDNTAKLWDLSGKAIQTLEHEDAVWGMAFSPNGKFILTGSHDNTAKLWDLNGKEIQTFIGHKDEINSVAFSPDGQFILTGSSDNTAMLWDLSEKEIQTFSGHDNTIYSVAFSPDGQFILTGSGDNSAKLWNLSGEDIQTFTGHDDEINSVAFSPDGQFILTGSDDNTAKLWDLSGKEIRAFEGHTDAIWTAAFSPDGRSILTGSFDTTVKLWNLNGNEVQSFKAHNGYANGIAFSPNNSKLILSGGQGDDTARLWDIDNITQPSEVLLSAGSLTFHQQLEYATIELKDVLAAEEDSLLIAGAKHYREKSQDEKTHYLKTEYSKNAGIVIKRLIERLQNNPGKNREYDTYSYLNDLKLEDLPAKQLEELKKKDFRFRIVADERLWLSKLPAVNQSEALNRLAALQDNDEEYFKLRRSFRLALQAQDIAEKDPTTAIHIAMKAREIDDNKITESIFEEIINSQPAIPITSFVGHEKTIYSVALSRDGQKILTGSYDQTAKLWDLNGKEIRTFSGHSNEVRAVAFSPDGNTILTGSADETAKLWDLIGKEIRTFSGHSNGIWSVAFSSGSKAILTGSADNTAKLWDLSGKEIRTFSGHLDAVRAVAFSPDGNTILTGSYDKTAKLWDLNGKEIRTFSGHSGQVRAVAFSPNGNTILTGSVDKTAKLWDLNGKEIRTFSGHSGQVRAVAFSPNGNTILTGSQDRTVKLWDLNGKTIQSFKAHSRDISCIALSFDGRFILTGSEDQTARLWDTEKISWTVKEQLAKNVIPALTFSQKLEYNTIELNEMLAVKEDSSLVNGANYYRRKYLDEKQDYLKKDYFSKATAVYQHILENRRLTFADSSLAGLYAEFGMLQLLSNDYKGAIVSAEKGRKLEKKPQFKNFSISALGHVLDGQFQEAEKMYLEWKAQYGQYPRSFSNDLNVLKRYGIRNSDLEKITNILK